MTTPGLSALRQQLTQRYEDLKRRLTWRLGSSDLASEALHDTWVHLEQRNEQSGPVSNPAAYLMRMATNLALDRIQRDGRYMNGEEVNALLDELADPAAEPSRVVAARSDVEALAEVIESMPPRRRAIFLAVRVDNLSNQEAAERFGVSARLIGLELKRAHEYCVSRMGREAS